MLNSLARRLFLGRGNATAPIVNVVRMEGRTSELTHMMPDMT